MSVLDYIERNREHFRKEGREARLNGLEVADCPYTPAAPKDPAFGVQLAAEWIRGWRDQDAA